MIYQDRLMIRRLTAVVILGLCLVGCQAKHAEAFPKDNAETPLQVLRKAYTALREGNRDALAQYTTGYEGLLDRLISYVELRGKFSESLTDCAVAIHDRFPDVELPPTLALLTDPKTRQHRYRLDAISGETLSDRATCIARGTDQDARFVDIEKIDNQWKVPLLSLLALTDNTKVLTGQEALAEDMEFWEEVIVHLKETAEKIRTEDMTADEAIAIMREPRAGLKLSY